jgi:signal transduction histidine kinase
MRISWLASILIMAGVVLAYWLIALRTLGYSIPFTTNPIAEFLPLLFNGFILVIAGTAVSVIGVRIKQALLAERREQEEAARLALQSAYRRTRLIFELASTLSATLNYELILKAALDVSDAGLREFFNDADDVIHIGLILLFSMDQTLYIAASRGIPDSDNEARFPAQIGVLAQAVQSADPIIVNKPEDDPELGFLQGIRECQQAIIVPLRAGYDSFGFLLLANQEDNIYTEDFTELLVAICNQAVLALQNASLYQNLMDDKDRLVTVEEDARKHLARNLHDGPTQTIAAIAMRLNYIRTMMTRDPENARRELADVENMARLTTKEIRQMLFTLRPLILESQGLVAAVEQLRQKLIEISEISIHFDGDPLVDEYLSEEAKGSIFYIIDEAITNARKHALAQNIWIRIFLEGLNVITEIEDDGAGFDVAEWESQYADRGNMGLFNVRERAVLVKGKTTIRSSQGKGTLISVTIPATHTEGVH